MIESKLTMIKTEKDLFGELPPPLQDLVLSLIGGAITMDKTGKTFFVTGSEALPKDSVELFVIGTINITKENKRSFAHLKIIEYYPKSRVICIGDLSRMFKESPFDCDISRWDTSRVTDMSSMFHIAESFKGDLKKWNTSKVTDMSGMFYRAKSFNCDMPWNTSKVTNMSFMFCSASSFNGDISKWNTSQVTNMARMFFRATSFDCDIPWNTSKVYNMCAMFCMAYSFNRDISTWDISKVSKRRDMFKRALIDEEYKPK